VAVEGADRWTGFAFGLFAAFHVEGVMDLLQRAVPAPQAEVAVHGAMRRQVLGDVAPLAASAKHLMVAVPGRRHRELREAVRSSEPPRSSPLRAPPPSVAAKFKWLVKFPDGNHC
jgi:hypothetical protein